MKKLFTFVIAAMAAMTMSAKDDLITFGDSAVAKGAWSNGKVFTGIEEVLSVKLVDPEGKMEIDLNKANFGTKENYDVLGSRLKTGGKSTSEKNYMEVTVAEDGLFYIFARTGSNSATDRNVVVANEKDTLLNQILKEEDAEELKVNDSTTIKIYPAYSAALKAGVVYRLSYPVGSINFYGFGFSNEAEEVSQVVTFDFSTAAGVQELNIALPDSAKGTNLSGATYTKDGVTFSCVKNNNNDTRIWNGKNNGVYELRTYKDNTLTFAAAENITAIEFEGSDVKFAEIAVGKVWEGSAKEVTFTATGTCKISKVTVYVGSKPAEKEVIEVSVAQALLAGNALDSLATSTEDYAVTGYVVNSQPFNPQYGNQIWFMADDAENSSSQEFEAYACNVVENGTPKQVIDGDIVKLTGKLTKYYDKNAGKFIIEIKNGIAEFVQKAEGNHDLPVIKVDTITVAEAIAVAQTLTPEASQKAVTEDTYAVKGYVVKIKDAYNPQYGNATFYMSDTATATYGNFQAYRGKLKAEDAEKLVPGAFVMVTGKIENYNGGDYNSYQIALGNVEILVEAPEVKIDTVSVAEALEIGQALADNTTTDKPYHVKGYVVKAYDYDTEYNNQNFYMADEADAFGEFYAFRAKPAEPVKDGDLIILTGKIKKYVNKEGTKTTIELEYGEVEVIQAAEGIENIVLTEKAQKVMVDGVMYIVRDGKMYDVRGTQVR